MTETLGQRIRKERKRLGITQNELRDYIGMPHRSAMSLVESDKRKVTADELIQLAGLFGVSADYLLGIEAPTQSANVLVFDRQQWAEPKEMRCYS